MEEKSSSKQNDKIRTKKVVMCVVGFLLIIAAVVLILIFLLRGNTTTTSEKIDGTTTTALNCISGYVRYPIFTYDNANRRELNIKMVFSGDDLRTAALDYSLFYDDAEVIKASEAHNHAAMNISYSENGFRPDEFNTKYTMLDDRLRMNLYANGKEINEVSAKYFLIDAESGMPKTLSEYRKNYAERGLKCETTE